MTSASQKNLPQFRKPEDTLWHPQMTATNTNPEPARTSPETFILFPENPFLYQLPSMPGSPSGIFPSGFHTKALHTTLLSPICAT